MLVLSRKVGQAIHIDGQIKVTVVKTMGNRVKIGIEAPDEISIVRSELDDWSQLTLDIRPPSESNRDQRELVCLSGG